MGQDGQDGKGGGDTGVTGDVKDAQRPPFDEEIRDALAYEKGLFFKAFLALALVALVVVLRALYFT